MVRSASPARPAGPSIDQDAVPGHHVLTASWCCSVGATWTVELRPVQLKPVELRPVDDAVEDPTLAGPVLEWICSGVPTELPVPEAETAEVLAKQHLLLFGDDEPIESVLRTRSRRLIGYVTRDPEVLRLALLLAELVDEELVHPMVLAAQWLAAGYSPEAATGWATSGIIWPGVAQTLLATELAVPDPLRVVPRGLPRPPQ